MQHIKEQFDKVIKHSQDGIDEPQTDRLFEIWKMKKSHIINAFGDKLIYEVPDKVTFELSETAKEQRITNFINYMWDMGYEELGRFLERQRTGFYKNKVIEEYKIADSKGTIVTKNTKLVKAFKYFIKNESVLNEMQSKASQLIQENKVEGTLCFSVHPLDYLSISENTYNWRSCHALDGEYRAGNLSYMMDSSTVVCYLRGEKEVKLPHFPEDVLWNSKKWRVLLYLSNDWRMIFAGKPYPFVSDGGMDKILEYLNQKVFEHPDIESQRWGSCYKKQWSPWSDYTLKKVKNKKANITFRYDDEYIPLNNGIQSLFKLVTDAPGSKHFNDVLKSSCYDPFYTYLGYTHPWDEEFYTYASTRTKFDIGSMTYCLRCGEEEIMDSGSTMMCYECERQYGVSENDCFCFCDKCGERSLTEEMSWVGDSSFCPECYNEYAERCDLCGDSYLKEDMIYDEQKDIFMCSWCYNHR